MAIVRNFLWIAFLFIPRVALACPSCALSSNQRFFDQTLISVGIMWLLPIVIAVFLGFKIYYICNNEAVHSKEEN